ncbi:MAG: BrnT family toxin [Bacilli bacterium]|nr:BrnT family toxin [Bacilli bacterium]
MKELSFEWDPRKADSNIVKHGIGFMEAVTVFRDPLAIIIADPDSSPNEERFLILGLNSAAKMLVVCYCLRENETVIRIISARKATTNEERHYSRRKNAA